MKEIIIFDFKQSRVKEIFDHYDGIPLIMIRTYDNKDYFLYVIDWDIDSKEIEYMLAVLDEKGVKQLKSEGVKSFLQSRLEDNELYHLTFGLGKYASKEQIRLITKEEALEAFPIEEFLLEEL